MKLSFPFLGLATGIFLIEVFIGFFIKDAFVRPFLGDVLVVILIYCFLRVFISNSSRLLVLGVCLFAFFVEFVQFFDPIGALGLQNYHVLSVVVGRTFSWGDLLAYLVGSCVSLVLRNIDAPVEE